MIGLSSPPYNQTHESTEAQLRVPNNRSGSAAWVAPPKLRVAFSVTATEWTFSQDLDPAVLVVSSDCLPRPQAVEALPVRRLGRAGWQVQAPGEYEVRATVESSVGAARLVPVAEGYAAWLTRAGKTMAWPVPRLRVYWPGPTERLRD